MIPRLKELYKNEIKNSLKEKYGFKNLNMSPELEKIVINKGEIKNKLVASASGIRVNET